MQHMDAFPGFMREFYQPPRRHQRRGLVSPHWMRARVALDTQSLAIVEAIFVLGMKRGPAFYHLENPPQAFIVLDQQRAGGRTDEHFHAGAARRALEFRQILHIVAGAADEERKIAMHAVT